jgi:hypothetical protein
MTLTKIKTDTYELFVGNKCTVLYRVTTYYAGLLLITQGYYLLYISDRRLKVCEIVSTIVISSEWVIHKEFFITI